MSHIMPSSIQLRIYVQQKGMNVYDVMSALSKDSKIQNCQLLGVEMEFPPLWFI